MAENILLVALLSLFVILTFRKWNAQSLYENTKFYQRFKHSPKYCEWCLSFWVCFSLCLIFGFPLLTIFASASLSFLFKSIIDK